jgi:lysyl-tRNA synthetase class 2
MVTETELELIAQRRRKLQDLREYGTAFPNQFRRGNLAADLHASYGGSDHDALAHSPVQVSIAGRMMSRRIMGKASFAHVQDMSGRIQLYVKQDRLAEDRYDDFREWDIGDIVGATGTLFKTKTGELSVQVDRIDLLTKSLRPLPEKFHGLTDQETRYRQRYLDLIANEDSRKVFVTRTRVIDFIRGFLRDAGYLEVETPMMQVIPGGAAARPFITFHNSLDMELFLRIAPELYLKRLLVGGFERVFEINRSFRNEGLSPRHNPEFTMLEFYAAYADYADFMQLTEDLLRGLVRAVSGGDVIRYQGEDYDFGPQFPRLTLADAILEHNPDIALNDLHSLERLRTIARHLEIPVEPAFGVGKLQLELFEKTVEHRLSGPLFITAYPTEVSPLARKNDADPEVTDRFEFFVGGREIANGFSELNDPDDQAERFRQQVKNKEAGDEEAMHFDADYIAALEYGMPPAAGEGIGIDRLVMFLTDSASIRDVILFPHLRPRD